MNEHKKLTIEQRLNNMVSKAKIMGLNIRKIPTASGIDCTLIEKQNGTSIIFIPDGVEVLNSEDDDKFNFPLRGLRGNLKIIGGNSLKSMLSMFKMMRIKVLDLTEFNTHNVTTMEGAFNRANIKQIIGLENLDTTNLKNLIDTFYMSYIPNINMSRWSTPNLELMTATFYESYVTHLDISNLKTDNVTNMSYLFGSCYNLKEIHIESFNTSKVTDMESMFKELKLDKLDLSHFDTSQVQNMEGMFESSDIKDLDLSSFNTSKVINMNSMFRETNIQHLDIHTFDTSNVLSMYKMFESAKIWDLDLSHFDTHNNKSFSSMFQNCETHELDLSNFNFDSAKLVNDMFVGCIADRIIVPGLKPSEYGLSTRIFNNANTKYILTGDSSVHLK